MMSPPLDFLMFTMVQAVSIVLAAALLFLGFKLIENSWSYKISKPWSWDQDVKHNLISSSLTKLERRYRDKVRFYTFWLQIKRLKQDQTSGAFAEVGVYRGETARIIHAMDDSRKLYLFDTFEGFSPLDLINEQPAADNAVLDFASTSEELAKAYIQGNQNVIFKRGYFPETTLGIDEEFAFVSIDADLYQPTLAALNFFYPRLVHGGVIMVHDYNHSWNGIRKAMDEFMPGVPESLVEIADWQGSAMIVRNKKT